MKDYTNSQDNERFDERECECNSVSLQKENAFPSAAAPPPVDGKAVEFLPDENSSSPDRSASMAESVTRHALISDTDNIEYLTCGIDSLDVGFYVSWGDHWKELLSLFDLCKENAQGTEGNLIESPGIRPHIFFAGGKAPNYRYHVRFPEYHCFIAITQIAKQSPNVYVSFTSEALHWELSERELIELVIRDIESLGGFVAGHKLSRCDLYADFRIPGGLSLDFVRRHKVGKAQKTNQYMDGDFLETFYVGDKNAPLQLRLYNKSVKIKKDGSQERWMLLWFTDNPENVWRIEFQIRRTILKEFRINTIDDLHHQKADLWQYMTGDWITLRCLDDKNQTRRTIHPFWEKVQSCVQYFGHESGSKRFYDKKKAQTINWHVTRIINLLISCAAIKNNYDPKSCLTEVSRHLLSSVNPQEFKAKAQKKSIELGIEIESENENVTDFDDLYKKIILEKRGVLNE